MAAAQFLIAKYLPDVFRDEPRNIGVVLWSPYGVVARFVGENPEAPGEVDDAQIPPFIASPPTYKRWVKYWRRELDKSSIRPARGGPPVARTDPAFLSVVGQAGPSNYLLAGGGMLVDPVPAVELPAAVGYLFENYVAVPGHAPIEPVVRPGTQAEEWRALFDKLLDRQAARSRPKDPVLSEQAAESHRWGG